MCFLWYVCYEHCGKASICEPKQLVYWWTRGADYCVVLVFCPPTEPVSIDFSLEMQIKNSAHIPYQNIPCIPNINIPNILILQIKNYLHH